MTARLGYPPSQTTPPSDPQSKNVDAAPCRQDFRRPDNVTAGTRRRAIWLRPEPAVAALTNARYLGSRDRKQALWNDVSRCPIERGDELAASSNVTERLRNHPPLSPVERIAADAADRSREFAELDDEEFSPRSVAAHLPDDLATFLHTMPPVRRREREEAILNKVGWSGLKLIDLAPFMLAEVAEGRAASYALRFPIVDAEGNPINRQPEHRRGRCAKIWRRRLKRQQNEALLYVEAALGAVGGPDAPGRPLYAADYSVGRHRDHVRQTEEALSKLLLVRVDDPTVRIPMLDVNERAKAKDAAKRRLLIDMHLARWKILGWYVCWITITLPGFYVPLATNEGRRQSEWNPMLGPAEAMAAIQDDHHRVLACLRDAGVRPSGWWNAQPQQSGTPHRHYVLACRSLEDARAVCEGFRDKFSSRRDGDDVQERGCRAYVLGDGHPAYQAPKGRNGKDETADSIARYAARYSTRYNASKPAEPINPMSGSDDSYAAPATGMPAEDTTDAKLAHDAERFAAWKRLRRARTHTWLGLDSRRAPSELWDTLWANSGRLSVLDAESVTDPRMRLAMRHMRLSREHADNAVIARDGANACVMDDEVDLAERNTALETARVESDSAGIEAWHAAVALGMWRDNDLDPAEREWLSGAIRELDPLPPEPLRVTTETAYGDERSVIKGAVAAIERFRFYGKVLNGQLMEVVKALGASADDGSRRPSTVRRALREAGIRIRSRPCGATVLFTLTGAELRTSDHDWKVVDQVTADELVADMHKAHGQRRQEQSGFQTVGLSLSPTDPRNEAISLSVGCFLEENRPPG